VSALDKIPNNYCKKKVIQIVQLIIPKIITINWKLFRKTKKIIMNMRKMGKIKKIVLNKSEQQMEIMLKKDNLYQLKQQSYRKIKNNH
jgi:hypothetical protein